MTKLFSIFLSGILFYFCNIKAVDYSSFSSIEEVINFETTCIHNMKSAEELSDAYASRGESLLLCGDFKAALDDFSNAYTYATSISDKSISQAYTFRALFNQALVYGYLNEFEMVVSLTDLLKQCLQALQCLQCNKDSHLAGILPYSENDNFYPASFVIQCNNDVPIYGPDQISKEDCIDFVNNTVRFAKLLITKSPPAVRGILTFTIDQLGDQARNCCYKGGVWRGCVQKLVNKYHLWNQKWQLFNIPPDPAWD